MLVQGLLLIAVIVLVSGSIITSTIVTAKTALGHAVRAQSQTAMSDATADFVAWAHDRVKASNARTSWAPRVVLGKSDTTEFKPMCGANHSASVPSPECQHYENVSWVVTGSTTAPPPASASARLYTGALAENMSLPVDEQRISAIISVDVDSANGRQTFASASRMVTARVFDVEPFVIITGVREVAASNGAVSTGQGDSAGQSDFRKNAPKSPDPFYPSNFKETRITATVNCKNSADVNQNNPRSGTGTSIIQAGRDGNMDWSYQTPCNPTYATPQPVLDPSYIAPVGDLYATVDGDQSRVWSGNSKLRSFPR